MMARLSRRLIPLALTLIGLLLAACTPAQAPTPTVSPAGLSVGDPAPDFSLPAAAGGTVSLADYRGQPVLLFFHMAVG